MWLLLCEYTRDGSDISTKKKTSLKLKKHQSVVLQSLLQALRQNLFVLHLLKVNKIR